jgi:hypothetical protein
MTNGVSKFRQSRSPSPVPVLKNRLVYINKIIMNGTYPEMNDEIFCYLPIITPWHQITSLRIDDPLDLYQLRLVLSKMINLRTLHLNYHFDYDSDNDSNNQNLIDLLNDTLCNILMINGLQKLDLYMNWKHPDMISIASLIVKQLPHLQIIELNCATSQVPETLDILMNGLLKLNFIIFHGRLGFVSEVESKIHDLRKKISVLQNFINFFTFENTTVNANQYSSKKEITQISFCFSFRFIYC